MTQRARHEQILRAQHIDLRGDRGDADARRLRAQLQLVVEARGRAKAQVRVRDDSVDALLHHLLPRADRRPPQLREDDVEIQQVVGVEDDALRVALAVAHAQLVDERRGHRAAR
jgi:hypothetical protein